MDLAYNVFEKIKIRKPEDRIAYIVENIKNKHVLDLGSYDETALFKKGTKYSLYNEISKVAASLVGVDNSSKIQKPEIIVDGSSRIIKCDARAVGKEFFKSNNFDVIVAGELIEHLANVLEFFSTIKESFCGKEFICTTPNATSFSNVFLSFFKRESAHRDHLQMYSYKTLNTLCVKCGFSEWDIIPYYVYYTEIIFQSKGYKKIAIKFIEKIGNIIENIFPLLSGGLILHVKKV